MEGAVTSALLRTKLYMPSRRPELVARTRLVARLNESLTRPLTLLSAPPGFGKTTLLREWLAQVQVRAVWLMLDVDDNDPVRFWSYFIAALQQIDPAIGTVSLALLQSPRTIALEPMLRALINEIDSRSEERLAELTADRIDEPRTGFVLVLDDYHVIETPDIHQQLSFLLEHIPPHMHLVISSRSDPPLPLARLRARDQLIELHERDLRFRRAEAVKFLNEVMSLPLTSEQIAALETRTEGWIAGLQLAALSLRGHDDVSGFVRAFTGSHRFVFDYLTDEVFARQTESIQSFLLQTSILERLDAALCNAVTGRADSQAILEELERNNLFLTALDDERRWYRYHHLFADVLRHRLTERSPDALIKLHVCASEWFEQQGLITEAVNHALLAQDWDGVARLIGDASESLRQRGEFVTLTHWVQALPHAVRHAHPAVCLTYARSLLRIGRITDAEASVSEAEHWLENHAQANDPRIGPLRGKALALRAQFASRRGEFQKSIELSQSAAQFIAPDDLAWRNLVTFTLGDSIRYTSNWPQAKGVYREAAALSESAGDYPNALYALGSLGELLEAEGQLHQAVQQFNEVLRLAQAWGIPNAAATGYSWVGLARVRCEWNELDAALQDVETGLARGQQAGITDVLLRGYHALGRIRKAQGNMDEALAAFDEAESIAEKMGVAETKDWIRAQRAQVWLVHGDIELAVDWASKFVSQMQDAMYPSVPTALAQVWLSQGQPDKALLLLDHALQSAQTVGRVGNALNIHALRAVVYYAQGDLEQAFAILEQALTLAEPEGYIRVFVDQGATMARLLRRMLTRSSIPDYVRRLLNELGEPVKMEARTASKLIDRLSPRELEVLHLIVDGATNQEIANELVLTVNTVKRHISNIFGKLEVTNRAQAIARAHQLNLL